MASMSLFSSVFLLLPLFFSSSSSSSSPIDLCDLYKFPNDQKFTHCYTFIDYNSQLHWNLKQSTKTIEIGYTQRRISSPSWIAWGINPNSRGMIGTQALIAYKKSNGVLRAYTSPITQYNTSLVEGNLSFPVSNVAATWKNNDIIIFATIVLPTNSTTSTWTHVFQQGPVHGDSLGIHPMTGLSIKSIVTFDFTSPDWNIDKFMKDYKIKVSHAVISMISWGFLMPIGSMVARYMRQIKSEDVTWFCIHRTCQTISYVISVAGFGAGLSVGGNHKSIPHRVIGISLFCLATLQAFASLLRPDPGSKYRILWNRYHRLTGVTLLVLSIVTIFNGFTMIDHKGIGMRVYTGVVIVLGATSVLLEIYTRIMLNALKNEESDNISNASRHMI